MSIVSIAGFAIVAAVLALTLKQYKPEFSVLITIIAVIVIFAAILDKIIPAVDMLNSLFSKVNISSDFAGVILKSIGVCLIVQIAADTCRDAGESSLASKIEIAGRFTILFLSLPLLTQVLDLSVELINNGGR